MTGSRQKVLLAVGLLTACGRGTLPVTPAPVRGAATPAAVSATTTPAGPSVRTPDQVSTSNAAASVATAVSAERTTMDSANPAAGRSGAEIEEPRIELALPSAPPPPTWDIDVAPYESHARVAYFVERFSVVTKETFEVALERQSRYATIIHAKLRAGGLPEDMIYLPLIESWYDPNAYSRAAAVGMWQFMTSTARGVGLRVDWWVDERRDPVRATDGAVAHLNELRADFGSVYLAAAAYNGGAGRLSRGLAQHAVALEGTAGDERFFALLDQKALRAETRDYVPKLIAAALVGKDPARYALTVRTVLPFTWDSVSVPSSTALSAVARALAVSLDTLLDYNPQILRGMTPPSGPAVWLRAPVGTAEGFDARFGALEAAERAAVKRVVTKEGDYITKIARAHGLTASQLNWYNPQATRLKNGNLHAGQRILVPRLDVVRGAREVPNPAIERYGTSSDGWHVVKRGENLGVIARRNGTSVARLKALNRLKSDKIRIGQKLRVR